MQSGQLQALKVLVTIALWLQLGRDFLSQQPMADWCQVNIPVEQIRPRGITKAGSELRRLLYSRLVLSYTAKVGAWLILPTDCNTIFKDIVKA